MNSEHRDLRLDALVLDLLEWLAAEPRPYTEVMDAWRTSCAKLPVWEEAVDRGLVVSELFSPAGVLVRLTPAGHMLLSKQRGPARVRTAGGVRCRLNQETKPEPIKHQGEQVL